MSIDVRSRPTFSRVQNHCPMYTVVNVAVGGQLMFAYRRQTGSGQSGP